MIKAEIINYCRESLTEIEKNIPKQYVDDVLKVAKELKYEIELSPHVIRQVRIGRIPNIEIVELLKVVASRHRQASNSLIKNN